MRYLMPKMLIDALADGSWKNVSPDVLRRCLGDELDDLQLFESTSVMKRLATNLEEAGYVDDPQFCMTNCLLPTIQSLNFHERSSSVDLLCRGMMFSSQYDN
jgi:hypothetical protein